MLNEDSKAKWVYSYVLLGLTIAWAIFAVNTTRACMVNPTPFNILEVSGTNVLLGAMITWCSDVKQYWFRKKPSKEVDKNE